MILETKEDFENAILNSKEIKHKIIFWTDEEPTSNTNYSNSFNIRDYYEGRGVYVGVNEKGKDLFLDLKDAPEEMTFNESKKWAESRGKRLPTPKELTLIFANKDKINESLKKHGEQLKDGWYWSSTEYNNYCAWIVNLSSGCWSTNTKYNITYFVRLVSEF